MQIINKQVNNTNMIKIQTFVILLVKLVYDTRKLVFLRLFIYLFLCQDYGSAGEGGQIKTQQLSKIAKLQGRVNTTVDEN